MAQAAPLSNTSSLGYLPADRTREIAVPFCVDLDNTLIWTDSLLESCLALVLRSISWLLIPFWLLRGKSYLKQHLAKLSPLDVSTLPYNEALLEDLRQQRLAGRQIYLCTGADAAIAGRVATYLGIFDDVIASDGTSNLVGHNKARELERRFGKEGFDYVGDSRKDVTCWRLARRAFIVNPSGSLMNVLRRQGIVVAGLYQKPILGRQVKLWLRAIRVHQWAKNILVFVPLVLSHRFAVVDELRAFLAFSFAASAGYLINDLLDLAADRKHLHKRSRPFASGALPVAQGMAAVPLLLLSAAAITVGMPETFALNLAAYFAISLSYSLWLKRHAPMDVITLASLYALRIAAGGAAAQIVISPWTLAVSVFLFLSLAMIKRVSELRAFQDSTGSALPGRTYIKNDIDQLSSLGASAGYISVLVTALYINSPDVEKLYSHPARLWFILPIMLHWISRIWLLASRGQIHQDPIIFALKDKTTYYAGVLALGVALLAI